MYLILVVSGEREQSLRAPKVNSMIISRKYHGFKMNNSDLKQGRQEYKSNMLEIKYFSADKRLFPPWYDSHYLKRTLDVRRLEKQMILTSRKPFPATSWGIMSRWANQVPTAPGIDTTAFNARSTRTTSSGKTLTGGASIDDIMKHGGWIHGTTGGTGNQETNLELYIDFFYRIWFVCNLIFHRTFNISWEFYGETRER